MKGDLGTIGLTHEAQCRLGDIVFLELPPVGTALEAGKALGVVESVKAVFEIYAPVSGEVVEVNGELKDAPEKVNSGPAWGGVAGQSTPERSRGDRRADGRSGLRGLCRAAFEGLLPLMRYLPKSPAERDADARRHRRQIQLTICFQAFPERFRLGEALKLPGPYSEAEVIQYFKERARENSVGYTSFLGAGVYNHLRSVVTDAIIQRGEFLTSYTPYQAEISQGTLQAIFEFQTLMCQLTGQEVANASMWDGSTATTEAVLMAERITRRRRVLVARSLHPEYREVLRTYARNSGLKLEEIPFGLRRHADQKALESAISEDVAALVVQSPNFFGVIEHVPALADRAHSRGALWSSP